ncbi:MAG TPA: T9SS type A sorting domain-containing protein, partial [Chitinophagaceae bacterium]
NGASGTVYTSHVANRMWIINESTAGGSNVNVTLQWAASEQLPNFDRTRCYVMQHNGTSWVTATGTAATGTDPYTQTKLNVTTFSPFAVETQRIPRPVTGIYPNPTDNVLNVVLDMLADQPVTLKVFDASGKMVKNIVTNVRTGLNQYTMNVYDLPAGVYLLRVSSILNDKLLVARFLKVN